MTRGRALILATLAAVAAGATTSLMRARGRFRLPALLQTEELVADLTTRFDRSAVLAEAPDAPVHAGSLEPGPYYKKHGGRRPALLTSPPSRVRFMAAVPPDAVLAWHVGVESPRGREPTSAGVRFSVLVDGHEAWSRTVNPRATRHDRRWFDERLDLPAGGGRPVEITLATDTAERGRPPAGIPGWSAVHILRRTPRPRQAAGPGRPNVLVLLIDTLRADRLGCYGASPSPTPTLDRLASHGLVFTNAVAQSSWTMPAVATLFTGLHPRSHGVLGGTPEASYLADTIPTIAGEAARAGITTIGVAANFLVSHETNLARGFETFVELPIDRDRLDEASAREVNDTFLSWLRANRRHRFLGYLHYMEPHEPYAPPPDLRPVAPEGLPPAVASGNIRDLRRAISRGREPPLARPAVDHLERLYDAEVRSWDRELAALLDGLAAVGVLESTVVVVIADHGEEFQEHGRLGHGTQLYDEVLHVPLVLVGPGVRPGRVPAQVQGIDLVPTLAGLLGIEPAPGLPGRNILVERPPRPAFSETHVAIAPDGSEMPLVSVRTGHWKMVHAPALGRHELYDLDRDPGETENRFPTEPEGAALAAALASWEATAPRPPVATDAAPAVRARLRALGYVD